MKPHVLCYCAHGPAPCDFCSGVRQGTLDDYRDTLERVRAQLGICTRSHDALSREKAALFGERDMLINALKATDEVLCLLPVHPHDTLSSFTMAKIVVAHEQAEATLRAIRGTRR